MNKKQIASETSRLSKKHLDYTLEGPIGMIQQINEDVFLNTGVLAIRHEDRGDSFGMYLSVYTIASELAFFNFSVVTDKLVIDFAPNPSEFRYDAEVRYLKGILPKIKNDLRKKRRRDLYKMKNNTLTYGTWEQG